MFPKSTNLNENSEKDRITFRKLCYELYIIDWLTLHRFTITDALLALAEYMSQCEIDPDDSTTPEQYVQNWENDRGIGGSIWACFDEFCENEYMNIDYMKGLLSSYAADIVFHQWDVDKLKHEN